MIAHDTTYLQKPDHQLSPEYEYLMDARHFVEACGGVEEALELIQDCRQQT